MPPPTETVVIDGRARAAGEALFGTDEVQGYARSPLDELRLGLCAVFALLAWLATRYGDHAIAGAEADVVEAFRFLSDGVLSLIGTALTVSSSVYGLIVLYVVIRTRRLRVVGYLIAGGVLAGIAFWLIRWAAGEPVALVQQGLNAGFVPDTPRMAILTATLIVLGPFVTRPWRRAGRIGVATLLLAQLIVAERLPIDLPLAAAVGAAAGYGILVAFGRPYVRPSMAAVAAAAAAGSEVIESSAADTRTTRHLRLRMADGSARFVKLLGEREWAGDVMFRIRRALRYKPVGDEQGFPTLRRAVEHEAMVSLMAAEAGVRTPRLRRVATVGGDSLLLAFDLIDGTPLDNMATRLSESTMVDVWRQVALLRAARIAHRSLHRGNVVIDLDGHAWLCDFGMSEVAANDTLLADDVAQLVCALAIAGGVDEAVRSAVTVLGQDAVAAALPRLQRGTLRPATRRALGGLLSEVQDAVAAAVGIDEPEYEQLQRVSPAALFTIVMLVVGTYVLIPQFADLSGIIDRVQSADWAYAPVLVAASFVTYLGAALAMDGSVPERLRFGPNLAAQVGAGFAGALAPSSLGGMALNVRFLQKEGVDPAVAVSSVGLNSVAGVVMHVALTLIFAGRSIGNLSPSGWTVGAAIGGVVTLALILTVVARTVPPVRRLVTERVVPTVRRSAEAIVDVLGRPWNLLALLGGSAVVTLGYIGCLYAAVLAFGGTTGVVTVGSVYLLGSAVASVAPTPGGLGAMEAALISGLVAAGVDNTIAVPAVFLYRLATYWLPILPGWGCFAWLRRTDRL